MLFVREKQLVLSSVCTEIKTNSETDELIIEERRKERERQLCSITVDNGTLSTSWQQGVEF
jgi:hypothetical protein